MKDLGRAQSDGPILEDNFQAAPNTSEVTNFGQNEPKTMDRNIQGKTSPIEVTRGHDNFESKTIHTNETKVLPGDIPATSATNENLEDFEKLAGVNKSDGTDGIIKANPGSSKITSSSFSTETVIRKTRNFSSSTTLSAITQEPPVKFKSESNANAESENDIVSISRHG